MNTILCLQSEGGIMIWLFLQRRTEDLQGFVNMSRFFISEINYTERPEKLYAVPL
jgi:hypothetical protein